MKTLQLHASNRNSDGEGSIFSAGEEESQGSHVSEPSELEGREWRGERSVELIIMDKEGPSGE